ncbi:MAG: ABC transporter ATP-binding protein, partial [Hyphomonadaceae bacterium]
QSAFEMPVQAKAQMLGYLAQERTLGWRLRAEDVAALGRHAWGGGDYASLGRSDQQIVDVALKKAGAEKFFGRDATQLSGGEQARVHLARVLATDARILLLDEPCAALDIRHQLDLMNVLEVERKAGRTIVTALHDLDLAQRFCTRLLVLKEGVVIADGAPKSVLTEVLLGDVFGLNEDEFSRYMRG